jgi:hypothetical protein
VPRPVLVHFGVKTGGSGANAKWTKVDSGTPMNIRQTNNNPRHVLRSRMILCNLMWDNSAPGSFENTLWMHASRHDCEKKERVQQDVTENDSNDSV